MRKLTKLLPALGVLALVSGVSTAAEIEEVVAKHIEAKGGREAWEAIETMQLTGSFTAFSKVAPFILTRKREHRYHLDHTQNGKPVIVGYDGELFWWDNHWRQPGASPVPAGPDRQAEMREIDFATPLFDWKERGFELELIGETEFEGFPAIGIKLRRPDDSEETWYLEPETYLEFAREYPGSDFGLPMPANTFYDNFREVGGVMIPHLVESQYSTRDRIMHVENVELNLHVDDKLFHIPAPLGMGPLVAMTGNWKVKTSTRQQPEAPWEETEREGTVEPMMRGALLEEHFSNDRGNEYHWTLSYDRFRKRYRYTMITDSTNHLDIREGDFDEEHRLVLSNVETGTTLENFGRTVNTRVTIFDIGEDGFQVHTEISIDGGENWFLAAKQEYTRSEQ